MKHIIGPFIFRASLMARYSRILSLGLVNPYDPHSESFLPSPDPTDPWFLLTRKRQQPVKVIAYYYGFSHHRWHFLQPFDLFESFFLHFFGKAGLSDLLAVPGPLLLIIFISQLFLDGLHSLPQIILFLGFFHLFPDPDVNFPLHSRTSISLARSDRLFPGAF